jgi:hypothetical protein
MTLFFRLVLFVSSYFPLSVILFLLYLRDYPIVAYAALVVGLLGLLFMSVYFFGYVPRVAPHLETVRERYAHGGEVMGYIASYVVPFVSFPLGGWQQIAALLIFLVMLGIIYVNSEDMLRINPTLNLLGYRLYEVSLEQGYADETYALITRRRVKRGDTLKLVTIENGIFVETHS